MAKQQKHYAFWILTNVKQGVTPHEKDFFSNLLLYLSVYPSYDNLRENSPHRKEDQRRFEKKMSAYSYSRKCHGSFAEEG